MQIGRSTAMAWWSGRRPDTEWRAPESWRLQLPCGAFTHAKTPFLLFRFAFLSTVDLIGGRIFISLFFLDFFCCQRRLRYIWISIGKINTEIVCWHAAESKPFELGWFNQVNCFHLFQFNNLIGIRLKYVEVIQLENLYSWKPRLKELFFEFELLMHRLICNFCIEMIS